MTLEELSKNGLFKGRLISLNKKSIGMMLESLLPTENVFIVTPCNVSSSAGVLTLTDKRLIFTSKILFKSVRHDFPIKNITSLSFGGIISNALIINCFNQSMTITAIDKKAAKDIINQYNAIVLGV